MPRLLLLLAALTLCGCWPSSRPAAAPAVRTQGPPTRIAVFSDGFHSGFIVPIELMPFTIDSDPALIAQMPEHLRKHHQTIGAPVTHVELGFSDERWVTYEDQSRMYAVWRLFVPGTGRLIYQKLGEAARLRSFLPERIRIELDLDPDAAMELQRVLLSWFDADGKTWESINEPEQFILATPYDYGLLWNCHDWTAHVLRRIGFPIRRVPFRTPTVMANQLAEGAELLKRKGVTVLGPGMVSADELGP